MRAWTGSVALCLVIWFAAPLAAQQTSPPRLPPGAEGPEHHAPVTIHIASKQPFPKGVTYAQLSSGLRVLVQENHAAPVATVRCYIHNTGSAYEGQYLGAGLSHLLEHLVAGGTTTKRSEQEIRDILDVLGGQTNAYTSDDITAFYIDCPAKKVNEAINLIADNMQFSQIPEKEFRREMGVVQRELEMGEADRSRVLYNQMKQLLFTEHPVRHPTIGYLSVVQQVKREEVIDFYKNRYVPQNMVFVVAGDVDTDKVLDEVLKNFKEFHRTTEREPALRPEPEQASARATQLEMEGPTTHFSIAWPTVPLQDPDLYPLDVASVVLTTGDSSRLVRKLQIERPIANSVSSASYTPGFVRGWFQVTVECRPDDVETVADTILDEIERLKTEPVSGPELAKAKRLKSAEHVFNQQTVQNQAELLASSLLSTGDPLFDEHYVEGIQTVKPEEIQAVAKKYFLPERRNTVIIQPLGRKPTEAAAKSNEAAESKMTVKKLPNGLTVLVKRLPVVPMVSIQAFAKAGSVSDTNETAGLASLSAEMLVKGTKKYTADQIAEYFDSVGGVLQSNSQRNSTFVQCSVLKDNFEESLGFVYEVVAQPTFPKDEFEKVHELQLSKIAARTANPMTEILDFWEEQLPKDNPYHHTVMGTEESVGKLTAADCKKFHSTYFVPSNMVLAVVGDIEVDATIKRLEDLFGKIPAGKAVDWPKYPTATPAFKTDASKHLTNQKKNTAMVLMSYPIVSIYDEKDRAALEMLDAVLTGGGAAGGRLHEELRGERLVYYVFGQQVTGFAPGYFVFLAQTRPDTLKEVVDRIHANIKKIREEGIPEDEFNRSRARLIASHAMRNTTASEQAMQAALDQLYGLGFDYEKGYDKRINAVKIEDVVGVVKKYFGHDLVVTSSPEK